MTAAPPPPPPRPDDHADLREHLAKRDGKCPSCGYDLHGVRDPRCPECAMPLDLEIVTKGTVAEQEGPAAAWWEEWSGTEPMTAGAAVMWAAALLVIIILAWALIA